MKKAFVTDKTAKGLRKVHSDPGDKWFCTLLYILYYLLSLLLPISLILYIYFSLYFLKEKRKVIKSFLREYQLLRDDKWQIQKSSCVNSLMIFNPFVTFCSTWWTKNGSFTYSRHQRTTRIRSFFQKFLAKRNPRSWRLFGRGSWKSNLDWAKITRGSPGVIDSWPEKIRERTCENPEFWSIFRRGRRIVVDHPLWPIQSELCWKLWRLGANHVDGRSPSYLGIHRSFQCPILPLHLRWKSGSCSCFGREHSVKIRQGIL